MLRCVAALTITAAWACSGVRSTDPLAAAGSIAPRLSQSGDRIVLSEVEPDAAAVPKTAIRDPLLAADSADIPSVVPLGDVPLADG